MRKTLALLILLLFIILHFWGLSFFSLGNIMHTPILWVSGRSYDMYILLILLSLVFSLSILIYLLTGGERKTLHTFEKGIKTGQSSIVNRGAQMNEEDYRNYLTFQHQKNGPSLFQSDSWKSALHQLIKEKEVNLPQENSFLVLDLENPDSEPILVSEPNGLKLKEFHNILEKDIDDLLEEQSRILDHHYSEISSTQESSSSKDDPNFYFPDHKKKNPNFPSINSSGADSFLKVVHISEGKSPSGKGTATE